MAWAVQGNLKGPKGDKGDKGDQGDPGQDGAGIEIAGSVPTYGDLPTDLGPGDAGAGYLVQADGKLYIWDGTQFPADGSGVEFRGPQGPKGDKGDQGEQGIQGIQGPKGDTGNAGEDGADATVSVGTTTTGAPGTNAAVTNTGTAGAAVFNFTIPRGDKGDAGNDGENGTKWFTGSGVPGSIPGSSPGDFYLDSVDGTYYVLE